MELPDQGNRRAEGASTGGTMELFTEDQITSMERRESYLEPEETARLLQHARRLVKLEAETQNQARKAFDDSLCNAIEQKVIDQQPARQARPEPRTFTNRVRESDFWHGSVDQAGQVEENMRKEGFECVSSIPMLAQHIDDGTVIYVHMHFRKP